MIPPTLQQVKDAAVMQGISESDAEAFFLQYNRQGWKLGNGLSMTDWRSALQYWHLDPHNMRKSKRDKTKLYPIKGKNCCERGCYMPAVHKISGAYDNYYCWEHIPSKVKRELEKQYYV